MSTTAPSNNQTGWLQVVMRATPEVSWDSDGNPNWKTVGWLMKVGAPFYVRVVVLCAVQRAHWQASMTSLRQDLIMWMEFFNIFRSQLGNDLQATNGVPALLWTKVAKYAARHLGHDVLPPEIRKNANLLRQMLVNTGIPSTDIPEIPPLEDMYPVERWGAQGKLRVANGGSLTDA
jgi:hypothetical protein